MEKLPRDFREFLILLNFHNVDYLLVGGYAVAIHGYPRYTGDIDFWIRMSETNAEKIVKVLNEFGFELPELTKSLFLNPDHMTRLGREPIKIEILNRISGVSFSEAASNAITVEVDAVSRIYGKTKKRAEEQKISLTLTTCPRRRSEISNFVCNRNL